MTGHSRAAWIRAGLPDEGSPPGARQLCRCAGRLRPRNRHGPWQLLGDRQPLAAGYRRVLCLPALGRCDLWRCWPGR